MQNQTIVETRQQEIESTEYLKTQNEDKSKPSKEVLSSLQEEISELRETINKNESAIIEIQARPSIPQIIFNNAPIAISILALAVAITALITRSKKKRALPKSTSSPSDSLEILSLRQELNVIKSSLNSLTETTRLLERAKSNQYSSREQIKPSFAMRGNANTTKTTEEERAKIIAQEPKSYSKSALVNALNSGDRQQLRNAATAEINITSDSENAIAIGRSITTELEVVPGGGSYWLVMLQGKAWLFPTERTLNGFAVAQPAKGLFNYQQQTIAKPQLIEPAALEGSGDRWSVKSMGLIGTP